MSTEIQTTLVSIRRAAMLLGLSEAYTRAIINNSPEIKVRRIGNVCAVSLPQVKAVFMSKGVKIGKAYESRKEYLGIKSVS
jgi:hypothetical protein